MKKDLLEGLNGGSQEEEISIVAYTRRMGANWQLRIMGGNIPNNVKGKENTTAGQYYIVRLTNTGNLDKTSPGWHKTWNKDDIAVDITSWKENFEVVKDHGRYILRVKLRDDAVVERWYDTW